MTDKEQRRTPDAVANIEEIESSQLGQLHAGETPHDPEKQGWTRTQGLSRHEGFASAGKTIQGDGIEQQPDVDPMVDQEDLTASARESATNLQQNELYKEFMKRERESAKAGENELGQRHRQRKQERMQEATKEQEQEKARGNDYER